MSKNGNGLDNKIEVIAFQKGYKVGQLSAYKELNNLNKFALTQTKEKVVVYWALMSRIERRLEGMK